MLVHPWLHRIVVLLQPTRNPCSWGYHLHGSILAAKREGTACFPCSKQEPASNVSSALPEIGCYGNALIQNTSVLPMRLGCSLLCMQLCVHRAFSYTGRRTKRRETQPQQHIQFSYRLSKRPKICRWESKGAFMKMQHITSSKSLPLEKYK